MRLIPTGKKYAFTPFLGIEVGIEPTTYGPVASSPILWPKADGY
jgi:hypothetical protein